VSHDPLCPQPAPLPGEMHCPGCDLIDRVRADERERHGEGPWASEIHGMLLDAERTLRAQIAADIEAAYEERKQMGEGDAYVEGYLDALDIAEQIARAES
jgi:flagellar biosynthesis/type III secretory pathway protein FliH